MPREKNPNLKVTTVSVDIFELRKLRSKLALKGQDFSEWLRNKIKEENQKP